MSTLTPNYNLEKPEATDPFGDFRQSYNDNMDIIDANLGGGGGHTIVDENGSDMPAESKLQFAGNVSVSDDNVNGATVVDVLGGGGNVYGAFVNTSNLIYSGTYSLNLSYTATEDCFIWFAIPLSSGTSGKANIDGVQVSTFWNGTGSVITESNAFYLKKGQTLTATSTNSSSAGYYVYGLTQGTNGIYAPVIYSDNERVIGVWRDNKPLYQKTVDCGLVTADSNWHSIAHGVSDMDVCTNMEAICIKQDITDIVNGYRPALNLGIALERNGANLQYMNTWFGTGDRRLIVTLRYTKTTDVAGSGNWNTDGVPTHHYSTSEQVIGTWIDNKPLYEKTFEHSGALIVDNSFANDIGSLVSVDQFIGCEGYFRRTNVNGLMYSLNGGTRPEGSADNKVSARYYNGNVQVAVNGYNDIEYIALTVRYTKSTD